MSKNQMITIDQEERALELEIKRFELEQRRSTALSKSAFFPDSLKGDVASAVIVYDLAKRMNISVMEVAQSIYIIYGKPSFSTSFLVARLNQSGYIQGSLKTVISEGKQSCYCTAVDDASGEVNIGMTITMAIAKAEGWIDKKGSKWVTIPELMLRKRAQSFFIKEFYPEVMFGVQSQEEIIDAEVIETKTSTTGSLNLNNISSLKSKPLNLNAVEIEIEVEPTPKDKMLLELTNRGASKKQAEIWCFGKEEILQTFLNDPASIDVALAEAVGA